MTAIDKLIAVKEADGKLNKHKLIKEYKDDQDFLQLLKILLDGRVVTNVKNIPQEWWENSVGIKGANIKDFFKLVEYLQKNNRSTKTLEVVRKFLETSNRIDAPIYAGVLTKSYKIGVTAKGVNQALEKPFILQLSLQKAEPFDESKVNWDSGFILGEEKYDGVRCAVFVDGDEATAFSYNGKVIPLKHITSSLKKLCKKLGNDRYVFDGEILSGHQRSKTSGLVNKLMKHPEKNDDSDLFLMVFNLMPLEEFMEQKPSKTNQEVANELEALSLTETGFSKIKFSKSYILRNMLEVDKLFYEVRTKGGEGLMLKDPKAKYEWKRSKTWLKMKSLYSTSLRVIDTYLSPANTKYAGLVGGLICETEDGHRVDVGSGLSDEDRVAFTDKSNIVGEIVEIAFTDVGWDKNGKVYLEFPRYRAIRFDKYSPDTLEQAVKEIPRYKKGLQ